MRTNIRWRLSELKKFVRRTHQKIGQIDTRADTCAGTIEKVIAIDVEVVHGVVLVRREIEAEFPVVAAFGPREIVVKRVGIVDFVCRPLWAESQNKVRSKQFHARRSSGVV